jgi:autotransporter-associated beta strand protein
MKPKYNTSKFRTANLGSTLVTVITVCFGSSAFALDNLWTGSLGTDWNNGGNWSDPHGFGSPHVPQAGGAHPGDEDAIINSITPGAYPVVVASPSANPRDVKIGVGAGQSGRVDHTAGTVSTGAGNWFAVGLDGGNGTYNLANVAGSGGTLTGMGQSAGGINANGSLYVPITGGSTGTFNMHTTGTVAVSNLFAVGDGGTGTFKMDSGTMTVGGEFWVGQGGTGNGAFSVSAGQITINSWVAVGRDGGVGLVNMTGGTITKNNGGTAFIVGASGAGGGTFNQSAGTVNVAAGDTWIGENGKGIYNLSGTGELSGTVVQVGRNGSATDSVLNLGGGTFRASRLIGGGASNDSVVFNGSQIIAKTNETAFIDAIDIATINAGGLKLDSNGRTLASTQIFDGPGGIVKSGAGTFTLTGAQLYDGTTAINAGTMVNGSSAIVRGDFTVADGATLGVLTALPDGQLIVNNTTFATTAAGAILNFNLGNFSGNSAFEALKIDGNLVMNGNVTINVSDQLPATGIIPLVKYIPANRSGAGEFVIGNLPLGVGADLIDDEINGVVYLDVESVALPRWEGNLSGEWDFATQNWFDLVSSLASIYVDNTPVLFNDDPDLIGGSTTNINLASGIDVKPSQITFNNSSDPYTIGGPGKISGPASLTKTGTAALTLNNTNEYTGASSFAEGPVTIATLADGGQPSSIGSSGAAASNLVIAGSAITYTGAAVAIDRGFTINGTGSSITNANSLEFEGPVVSASGNLSKLGAGSLTFSNPGANVFGTVNQGLRADGGSVVFNGSGTQTNSVFGEMWIGSVQDVPAHVVLNGATLNVGSWIALGRGNGSTGALSTLTATNSTIQCTNFSTGFNGDLPNNDSDQTVTVTNTNWTNGGATLLAESLNSTTEMTLSGTTQYTGSARFLLGLGQNSVATVTVEGNAGIVKTGQWTSIGNSSNGSGTLNVKDNGSFSTDGDFNISDVDTSQGTINLSGNGTISSTGQIFIGKNTNTSGTVNQSGGTFNVANWVSVARFSSCTGALNVSGGTFNQTTAAQGIIVGEEGNGVFNISGTGAVNITADAGLLVSNNATGTGTVNLDGGTLTTKRVQTGAAGAGSATFNFDGGALVAAAGANADFFSGMDNAIVEDGGAFINSNGNNISISQNFSGDGGITKSGSGTLFLNGNCNNTGDVTVSAGTLGGVGTIAGNLVVASGANVNPGANLGILNAASATFQTGSSLTIDLDASPDMLAVPTLTLNNTALVLNGTPTLPVYLLVRYGSYTGTFSTPAPAGYAYDYEYESDGFTHVALVQTATPYGTWINTFFPGETNPLIIGAEADPDNDGNSNALEFALGGAPNSGSNNAKVYSLQADGSVDGDSNKELLLTVAVRSGTPAFTPATGGSPTATQDGFVYTIQGSLDLAGFATTVSVVAPVAPASNPTAPAGYEYRTFSLDGSNNLTTKGFLRVKVNPAP